MKLIQLYTMKIVEITLLASIALTTTVVSTCIVASPLDFKG